MEIGVPYRIEERYPLPMWTPAPGAEPPPAEPEPASPAPPAEPEKVPA